MTTLWWGTYPKAGLGTPTGQGEGVWRHEGDHAQRALELPAPSFLVAHPHLPLLYAICETSTTQVHAIDVSDAQAPRIVSTIATGGQAGCHLLMAADASTLYASHYNTGDLAVLSLDAGGRFTRAEPTQRFTHAGSGPRADRQESSHAHFAGYSPAHTHVLVADLGTDELRRYEVLADGTLREDGIAATLPPGAGPRHFAVRGNLIYVVCELDHMLRTLRWEASSASAQVIAEQPTTLAPVRSGDTMYDAHVVLVGDTLLVSVRGCDVISVFDLAPEGEARYRGSVDTGVWPRHFAVGGEHLWVGAEKGHEVRQYHLVDFLTLPPEPEVGHIAQLKHRSTSIPSPACVVAMPGDH